MAASDLATLPPRIRMLPAVQVLGVGLEDGRAAIVDQHAGGDQQGHPDLDAVLSLGRGGE
ncbi:hypothetical protein ACWDA3_61180 [Nonomuraea rubra]